jgi:hypothetical protein
MKRHAAATNWMLDAGPVSVRKVTLQWRARENIELESRYCSSLKRGF